MSETREAIPCPVCFARQESLPPMGTRGPCTNSHCSVSLERLDETTLVCRTFRLTSHDTTLVLPFAIDEELLQRVDERLLRAGRWARRTFSWEVPGDRDRTEYFLPYVRRFLFPSLTGGPGTHAGNGPPPIETTRHYDFDLTLLGAAEAGLALDLQARDTTREIEHSHALDLRRVALTVFNQRVAFLSLEFQHRGADVTFFDQMKAATYLRPFFPLFQGFEMPRLGRMGNAATLPQWLAWFLAECTPRGDAPRTPWEVEDAPLPVRAIYDDRMLVYTYSCIDRDSVGPDLLRNAELVRRHAVITPEIDPDPRRPDVLDPLRDEGFLRQRWQGTSLDGRLAVTFDADRFHVGYYRTYWNTYYYDVFLLANLQRATMLTLFERMSDIGSLTDDSGKSRRALRRVRRDLLLFKNQCWFSQITNRERGLVIWRQCQEVLDNETLMREVNEQSEELESYLRGRRSEQVEILVRIGGFLAATIPLVLGLSELSPSRASDGAGWQGLPWLLIAFLLLGSGLLAWIWTRRIAREA